MIVDQNGRDHFGRPQALTPSAPSAPDQARAKAGSGGSLWPSRGRSDRPSLDTSSAPVTRSFVVLTPPGTTGTLADSELEYQRRQSAAP